MTDLNWMDITAAAMVGVLRQIKHRSRGDKHRWNAPLAGGWDRDIESSCAEKYVAKNLGLYWFDCGESAGCETDVGPYQVRHTCLPNGRLTLHPEDKDHEAFILVIGRAPTFEMIGWCFGHEGKRNEYWEDPSNSDRPAFYVPRQVLRPISELEDAGMQLA
jgi:hypothetical protein